MECNELSNRWRGYYLTAYGIAVKHGFKGTEAEWLESLKGEKGDPVVWKGQYNTLEELELAHPAGREGDAYLVGMELYWWDGDKWSNAGSIQGPKGDTGATGLMGPQGPKGDAGDTGAPGLQGPKGDQGERGETGRTGPEGPQGLKGETGERGPQGPKGEKGDTGATGPRGQKGDPGDTGPQGPKGERGEPGERGPRGEPGPQGPKGETGTGLDIKGTHATLLQLETAVPAPAQGDMYNVGTAAPYTIYMWDTTGEPGWKSQGQLQGPAGEQGPQGEPGTPGRDGEPGAAGPQGPKGDTGDTGPRGPKGDPGDTGPQGPKGDAGAAGSQGPKGDTGPAGAPGKDGKSAYQAAVDKGYTGTEEAFNTALAGMKDAPFLPLKGGAMTGDILFQSGGISFDAQGTKFSYIGTGAVGLVCQYLQLSRYGSGDVKIVGVDTPTGETDAANKRYVDGLVGNINSALDAINGEVV